MTDYAITTDERPGAGKVHAICNYGDCTWERQEASGGFWSAFLEEGKAHALATGHDVRVYMQTSRHALITRVITDEEED